MTLTNTTTANAQQIPFCEECGNSFSTESNLQIHNTRRTFSRKMVKVLWNHMDIAQVSFEKGQYSAKEWALGCVNRSSRVPTPSGSGGGEFTQPRV